MKYKLKTYCYESDCYFEDEIITASDRADRMRDEFVYERLSDGTIRINTRALASHCIETITPIGIDKSEYFITAKLGDEIIRKFMITEYSEGKKMYSMMRDHKVFHKSDCEGEYTVIPKWKYENFIADAVEKGCTIQTIKC